MSTAGRYERLTSAEPLGYSSSSKVNRHTGPATGTAAVSQSSANAGLDGLAPQGGGGESKGYVVSLSSRTARSRNGAVVSSRGAGLLAVGPSPLIETAEEDMPTATSFGLSLPESPNHGSSESNPCVTGGSGGAGVETSKQLLHRQREGRSGSIAAQAKPAPVLAESSIRRRYRGQSSRQASFDSTSGTRPEVKRVASYLAPTESSLRRASLGSNQSLPASVRRLRLQVGSDEEDDLVSLTSQSVRSVRPAPMKPRVNDRLTAPELKRHALSYAKSSSASNNIGGGLIVSSSSSKPPPPPPDSPVLSSHSSPRAVGQNSSSHQSGVVIRGGPRVAAPRASSPPSSREKATREKTAPPLTTIASASAANESVGAGSAAAASRGYGASSIHGSPSLTTITVSDDDTGDMTKSGVSVSLSPMTSGNRTRRTPVLRGGGPRGGGGGDSDGGQPSFCMEGYIEEDDEVDAFQEPVPRSTQPVSFDASHVSWGGSSSSRAPAAVSAATPAARYSSTNLSSAGGSGRAQKPPLSPRDFSRMQLNSNTAATPVAASGRQSQQYRGANRPAGGVATTTGITGSSSTVSHRIASGGGASSVVYSTTPVKNSGDREAFDDTPISVLKERANREAELNARRSPSQPQVPRLQLAEITARRDGSCGSTHSSAASHSNLHNYFNQSGYLTPASHRSAISIVTVSSMTDSGSPLTSQRVVNIRRGSGSYHGSANRPTAAATHANQRSSGVSSSAASRQEVVAASSRPSDVQVPSNATATQRKNEAAKNGKEAAPTTATVTSTAAPAAAAAKANGPSAATESKSKSKENSSAKRMPTPESTAVASPSASPSPSKQQRTELQSIASLKNRRFNQQPASQVAPASASAPAPAAAAAPPSKKSDAPQCCTMM